MDSWRRELHRDLERGSRVRFLRSRLKAPDGLSHFCVVRLALIDQLQSDHRLSSARSILAILFSTDRDAQAPDACMNFSNLQA